MCGEELECVEAEGAIDILYILDILDILLLDIFEILLLDILDILL